MIASNLPTPPAARVSLPPLWSDAELMTAAAVFRPGFLTTRRNRVAPELFTVGPLRELVRGALDQFDRHGAIEPLLVISHVAEDGDHSRTSIEDAMLALPEFDIFGFDRVDLALVDLEERHSKLAMQSRLRELVRDADDPNEATPAIIERMERLIASQRGRGAVKLTTLAETMLTDPAAETETIIKTGMKFIDDAHPHGGLAQGEKWLISSPPGCGKTALALQNALGALIHHDDLAIAWAAAEMTLKALRNRALCCLSGLPLGALRRQWDDLSPLQRDMKRGAIDQLRTVGKRLSFIEAPITPARIEAAIVRTGARLVVIDYVQLLSPDREASSRRDAIDSVVQSLCSIAQRHGCAMIILSNLAKGATSGRDIYGAAKESSELPHACDIMHVGELITEPNDDGELPDVVEVRWRCLKARAGAPRSILTRFDRPLQRFGGLRG